MILCCQETPIIADEDEKKTGHLSNIFATLLGIFFVSTIIVYSIKGECFASIVLGVAACFFGVCFACFSSIYCDLRDNRHKKNVEVLNDFKGKWLPSGDGTESYIVNGEIRGIH